jgi:hypothetical protein
VCPLHDGTLGSSTDYHQTAEEYNSRRMRAHIVVENEAIYLAPDYTKALTQDEELVNAKLCLAPTWSYAGK